MNRLILLFNCCMVLMFSSCQEKHETTAHKAHFLVTKPLKKDTLLIKDYVAQVHAISHIELKAQEKGYLEKIYIDEGQFVKKGQLLFQIMPNLYEAEMQKAKAEAKFAEIEYANTKRLADGNIVAPNELAMAKAHYEKAQAELALAQTHLQFTTLRAPFDGIIDRFHVRLGSFIDENELITNLSDNRKMWVYFNVPESEYLNYKMAKDDNKKVVQLLMPNQQYFDKDGIVETIEADFNNETGNIAFRATFPNPDGLLRHGETGTIVVKIPFKDAILIPQKATFEVLEKKFVYVVTKDKKIKSREIKIAGELPHLFLVSEGLNTNDQILLEGLGLVRENQSIQFEIVEPQKVLSNLDLYAE